VIILPFFKQNPIEPGAKVSSILTHTFPTLQGNARLLSLMVAISIFVAFGGTVAIARIISKRIIARKLPPVTPNMELRIKDSVG
jgi:hypothetical protein